MTTEPAPKKSNRNRNIIIGVVVLLFVCGGCFALMPKGTSTPTTTAPKAADSGAAPVAQAPANTEAPAVKAPGIGVPVTVGGKATWTVVSATDLGQEAKSDNQYVSPITTTGKFLEIVANVKAEGSDAFMLSAPKIKDSQGREFDASSDAIMILGDKYCVLENVNPGIAKDCTWIYELPADASGLKLMAAASLFDKAEEIDLGQ